MQKNPTVSEIESLFDWFWCFNSFCGSRLVPRLLNSATTVDFIWKKIQNFFQWHYWVGCWLSIYLTPLLRNFPLPFRINIAYDNETETCKQVECPGIKASPEDASKRDVRAVSSKLGFSFSSVRGEKEDREELRLIWECRWKIYSFDFKNWARMVAPTATNLLLQNLWACGSARRKQFTRSHLSSQRESLGKFLTNGSYDWNISKLWQKRTAGQISKLM